MAEQEKVNWTHAVQVVGGPVIAASDSMSIVGYEKYRLLIADTETGVATLGDADGVRLAAIVPEKPHAELTYKVGSDEVKLDRAHVFAGEGAVGFIEEAFPDLTIENSTGADAVVDILVART